MERRGVLDDGGGRPSAGRDAILRSAVSGWRAGLAGLTATGPLLDLASAGAGVIEVARPGADEILARLRRGGTFTFRSLQPWRAAPGPGAGPHIPPGAGGQAAGAEGLPAPVPYILDTDTSPDDLAAALAELMWRSGQQYLERGLPGLYLAFGTLTWTGRDRARRTSPLLLVPARLVAAEPRQPPMLEPADDDPLLNPALALALPECGVTLPRPGDPAEITLGGLLDAVRAAVAARDGWAAAEGAALACFPPMREAIYRDLLDHEDRVLAHPAVRALAARGAAGGVPALDAGAARPVGAGAAPEVSPLVLPADSSQRACVAAALAGHSFTIDGPPGTGKSQTIANMAGALLHAGKSVLVVSEKAAALDVVADRLAGAGLGGYLLELHSHHATRARVAASLGQAAGAAPAGAAAAPAGGRPEQLSAYASAMNRVRQPLGYSLHDVLGMLASLQAVPAAPAPAAAPARLTEEALSEIRRAAADLAAAWRPAAQGRSFAWRGVTGRGPLDGQLYQAATALETLAGAVRANQTLADATGLTRPSSARELARLIDHLLAWPEAMPDEWLTADTLDAVDAAVAQLAATLTAIAARESQASQMAGVPWSVIPDPGELPADGTGALSPLKPACADVSDLTAGQIGGLARDFSGLADMLESRLGTLAGLARELGLRPPVTFSDANDLLTLARLASEPDRPERAWLSVPGHRAATHAAQVLFEAHRALATAEADGCVYFTPDALRHDVDGLAGRFANGYRGVGRLSGDYRADKRAIAAFTREGVPTETAQERLGLAAAWKHAVRTLADAEARHAALLGPHYEGRATDFARIGRALTHAAIAVRCARGQDLSRAAGHISRDATPNRAVTVAAVQARRDLSAWQAALAPAPAIAPRPELLDGTIGDAIMWLRAHLEPLRAAIEFTRAVGEADGRQLTFGQARQLVALREAADSARGQLTARDAVFRELFGQLYAGAATDVIAMREALEWARRLRSMFTGGPGPLTPAHLTAAESAVPTERLAGAAAAWQEACGVLLDAFGPQRRRELAAELDDYQAGDQLLEAMFNDTSGRDEWHAYQAARAALAAHGLDTAASFCVAERVEPSQVPKVIERALLRGWADYQLRTDPALAPLRDADPGALVTRYQQLDKALSSSAAADAARACEARRAGADAGESAVIRLEAARKAGHMPVAELLERVGGTAQALTPCFLMSPLAVSQYLPAGMRFDVVVFDEAGQIGPADAIGSIYRAGAVILAGDRRQLPPATLPGAAGAAGHVGAGRAAATARACDPESVLGLAVASGAFGSVALVWHYRSRHEALIAFSNAAFYSGSLTPLPGGDGRGPDSGVEQYCGEGTYRDARGGSNPGEAARVAQRVIHHADTRPGLSLGVVAFSEAQARAIEAAVDGARRQRPDLDTFFTGGRLRGFFIKTVDAVQGDERDVVIVSVGYGPDEQGRLTAGFGPLGEPGGWRRLNVAITRARYRTEIISSIQAGDIPESGTPEGLGYLRRYLGYSAKGR